MRALLALMAVLLLVVGALFYLFGNPFEELAKPSAGTAGVQQAPVSEAEPLVAARGEVTDATTPNIAPTPLAPVGPVTPPAPASQPRLVEQEARQFLDTLTEPAVEPVGVTQADHFVRPDQVISMVPTSAIETTTLEELKQDPNLTPDTPITVVRTVEQVEATTPQRIIADSEGNLDASIRVLGEDHTIEQTTVREVLERHRAEPSRPIMVVREVEHYEITTIARLEEEMQREEAARQAAAGGTGTAPSAAVAGTGVDIAVPVIGASGDAPAPASSLQPIQRTIRVIREPYKVSRATIAEILRSRNQTVEPDSVFYVRTVRPGDEQGIWGIVQDGIIENFGRGVAIRRGEEINTFRVDIPRDADEVQADRTSSFLGRMIYDKSRESHVYNYRLNRMGQSPDRIFPGQELVIIQFHQDELVSIYRHFVEQRG